MDELIRKQPDPQEQVEAIMLSRNGNGAFVLSHAASGKIVQVDEHTASKLMLLESFGETVKSCRLASRLMGEEVKKMRSEAALREEIERKEQKRWNRSAPEILTDVKISERKGSNNQSGNGAETGKGCGMEVPGDNQERGKEDSRNTVLDAHVTGIGAGGDFHLAARVQEEKSGEIHDVRGTITGLDAALLRSDANEQGKYGTILRNAQALASENFEKGMSAAFTPNNAVTMKME